MTHFGTTYPAPARHLAWFRRPASLDAILLAAVLGLALLVAGATLALPIQLVLPGAALMAGAAVLGPELVIVAALLAAAGLLPFVDPTASVLAGVKGYFLFFSVATATMVFTWSARVLAGRPSWPVRPHLLLVVLLAYLAYVGLVMAATDPLAQPTLAAPFLQFPLMAVATYLWLSHEDAMKGLKRVLPIVVMIVVAWAVAYVAGAGGCEGCRQAIGSDLSAEGLWGPDSRVYAPGQNSLLALVLVAFGQALRRPRPLVVGLAALGLLCIALQFSRAQYFGVAAGMVVLIAWRLRESEASRRLLLGTIAVAASLVLLASPVGQRALTGYEDVRAGTGTWGHRETLLERASEHWSLLGAGITAETRSLGANEDLGVSNAFLVVGFIGGALQLAVLALAFVWGLRARTLAGATIAAIFLLLLVTRPSLPLMELGHSSITYGAAVAFAAWLFVPPRQGAPGFDQRRSHLQLARVRVVAGASSDPRCGSRSSLTTSG